MNTIDTYGKSIQPSREAGLSLVELMVSITIGLLLLAGLTSLIVHQSHTRGEMEKASQQIENGRYAMQILKDDIEHAGFYGQYYNIPAPTSLSDPCATDIPSLVAGMSLPIQGYDAPTSVPSPLSTCLSNANHVSGTDILVIRRTDTSETSMSSAAAGAGGQVYLQTTSASAVMNTGSSADTTKFPLTYSTSTNTSSAGLRTYIVHIYFVSPCNTMANGSTCTATDDGGTPIPTLKRLELSASGTTTAFTTSPLVEGIDNLQLDYGIDNNNDGYPDSYPAADPTTTSGWSNVMAIRINLLARNTERTTGFIDSKSYNLGSNATSVGPFNDSYKRHVYTEIVRAVNPSSRRAQQ